MTVLGPQWQGQAVLLVALASLLACSDEPGGVDGGGAGGTAWSGGASASGGHGGSAATGGTGGTSNGGGGGGDLGWPLDDTLPARCQAQPDAGGSAWDGWGNLQHPEAASVIVGETTPSIYGRTYASGETPGVGQATGWEAELAAGPRGTLPIGEGRCWSFTPATFNVDAGNDDEYIATLTPAEPGLFSLFYRFRPPGGAWRYGDLDGSDDGVSVAQGSSLAVAAASNDSAPVLVVTLNLRCRLDDWAARKPLVIEALARVDPDLIAFQEDCIDAGGPSQAEEIRTELATYTRRGYAFRRVTTHQADAGGNSYAEGISLLSAHAIVGEGELDLPYEQIPRKALAVDVVVRGQPLRFYSTHFDFGSAGENARAQAAAMIVDDLPSGSLAIVAGDLNADPEEAAISTLGAALADQWVAANPSLPGATFPAGDPSARIDYLFTSPALTPLGAKILDASSGATYLSDHYGVALALSL